jgi:predicted nuclease of restriction endonuclease-like (RecB) superfamily
MTDTPTPVESVREHSDGSDGAPTGHERKLAPVVRVSRIPADADLSPELLRDFNELIAIIERAKAAAYQAVNRELIGMHWDVGGYISGRLSTGRWGDAVVKQFSTHVQRRYPGVEGFSPSNIWRMRQFFDTYHGHEKLAPLVREIPWTHNLIIMARIKDDDAKEFYLSECAQGRWGKRALNRQIDSGLYERTTLSARKHKVVIANRPALAILRDSYALEFLELPPDHHESDIRSAIVAHLRDFLLEFGRDFTLVGEEYPIQIGMSDFRIDLLLYHRSLSCLVAIELKKSRFKAEHLGQLNLYLEALDRDVKKPEENPSVGLVLCKDKDDTVVEYALSRSLSPAMVAEYQLHLPNRQVLQAKLRELTDAAVLKSGQDGTEDQN